MLLLLSLSRIAQCLSVLILLSACGVRGPSDDVVAAKPDSEYASDLLPFLYTYESDARRAEAPVSDELRRQLVQVIWVDDLGKQGDEIVLGRCDRLNENHPDPELRFRTVKIRRPDANGYAGGVRMDSQTLKTIIYHEFGHCLHDFRGHLPENSRQIMSSALPKERFDSLGQLIKEHFALIGHGH